MSSMNETTLNELQKLMQAVKALSKTVERAVMTRTFDGAGAMMVKSYRSLQRKATEILPDDFFLRESLDLELPDNATDEQMAGQVRLGISQMQVYLDEVIRAERPFIGMDTIEDIGSLGKQIQEQVLSMTKTTLKRAMSNIDFGWRDDEPELNEDGSEEQPKRKRIKIVIGGSKSSTSEHDATPDSPDTSEHTPPVV